MGKYEDFTNKRFGRLTVLETIRKRNTVLL